MAAQKSLDRYHPKVNLELLLVGAAQIAQRLYTLSGTLGPRCESRYFYTRVRAKTAESIRKKIFRKQRGIELPQCRPDYCFRDLTDLVGFRIVTLYDDELIDAIDFILELIRAGQLLSDPLFCNCDVWEIFNEARFISRSDCDRDAYRRCLEHLEERMYGESRPASRSPKLIQETARETRYSSAHMIFSATSYIGNESLMIPVEFQFRTAAEDIWAELNHQLIYKIDTAFVWSQAYGELRTKLQGMSAELKTKIDDLPQSIDNFYDCSRAASAAIEKDKYWGTKNDLYPYSLVVALFSLIGRPQGRDEQIPDEIATLFRAYGKKIDDLKEAHKYAKALESTQNENLLELLTKFQNLRSDAANDALIILTKIKDYMLDHADKDEDKLAGERISLLELEQLRLRTLLSTYFQVNPQARTSPQALRRELGSLYSQLCEYLERPLALRPMCMILFFKYIISNFIGADDLRRKNLLGSYELLDIDRTIPKWSIYSVLLPRHLAQMYTIEADGLLSIFEGGTIGGGLRLDIITKLNDAMGYALRAAQEHAAKPDDRDALKSRGDIIFGFEDREELIEFGTIINIFRVCKKYFEAGFFAKSLLPDYRVMVKITLNRLSDSARDMLQKRGMSQDQESDPVKKAFIEDLLRLAEEAIRAISAFELQHDGALI